MVPGRVSGKGQGPISATHLTYQLQKKKMQKQCFMLRRLRLRKNANRFPQKIALRKSKRKISFSISPGIGDDAIPLPKASQFEAEIEKNGY